MARGSKTNLGGNKTKRKEGATTPATQDSGATSSGPDAKLIGSLSVVAGLVALAVGGVLLKDQIKAFLDYFIAVVDDYGPRGYVAYMVVYAGLELLAVPAIPLTMTAGVIFGPVVGAITIITMEYCSVVKPNSFIRISGETLT